MKNKNFRLLGLALTLMFLSCETESVDDTLDSLNSQVDLEDLSQVTTDGLWRVSEFIDSGENKTNDFDGYLFDFQSSGALIAENASNTIEGRWSLTMDSNDDSGSDDDNNGILGDDCQKCTVDLLTEVLTACEGWYIEKLEDASDNDLENAFTGYQFNFTADGTVKVSSDRGDFSGSWEASGNGQSIKVTVSVDGLAELNMEWNLHEIELYAGESKVDLRFGDDNRLRFKNSCTINLSAMGGTDSGSVNTLADVDFNIFFASPEDFNELSEDWKILSYSTNKIELKHVSGGNGGTDMLTFER